MFMVLSSCKALREFTRLIYDKRGMAPSSTQSTSSSSCLLTHCGSGKSRETCWRWRHACQTSLGEVDRQRPWSMSPWPTTDHARTRAPTPTDPSTRTCHATTRRSVFYSGLHPCGVGRKVGMQPLPSSPTPIPLPFSFPHPCPSPVQQLDDPGTL